MPFTPVALRFLDARCWLTPKFRCKHTITIAAKSHPKSAWLLQRSLGGCAELAAATRLKEKLDEGQDDLNTVAHTDRRRHSAGQFRLSFASEVIILNAMANCIILARVQPHASTINATVDIDAFDTLS